MEEQNIRFSSGFLSFCFEENLRGLGGYKLNMVADLSHLRGRVSAVIADIGLKSNQNPPSPPPPHTPLGFRDCHMISYKDLTLKKDSKRIEAVEIEKRK